MDQTPIIVRGRKGNKTRKIGRSLELARGSRLSTPSSSRSTSRSSTPTSRRSQRDVIIGDPVKVKSRRYLSNFEKLPNELLHRIFLYALNLDLPAVSPHLSQALNGVGAKYLQLEYSLRSLYKPLSQLRNKWHKHEDLIFERPEILELLKKADPSRAECEGESLSAEAQWTPTYKAAKRYLVGRLGIVRWKEYRERGLQQRLVQSRFFNWNFLQTLIRKAHLLFQNEITRVHSALGLEASEMLKTEQWWAETDANQLLADMQGFPKAESSMPDFRQHNRLPWLRLAHGVAIPSRLTRGPWAKGDDILLYWLVQGNCGTAELDSLWHNGFQMMPLQTRMLADAVTFGKDWIAFICIIRARTAPTIEMLRQAVVNEPFPFVTVRNLLWKPRDEDAGGGSAMSHTTVDTLDPQVWSFIEQQADIESHKAKTLTEESKVEDCISIAKWLKRQLRQADPLPEGGIPGPYFPLRPPVESIIAEILGGYIRVDSLRDVPVNSPLWDILITPE